MFRWRCLHFVTIFIFYFQTFVAFKDIRPAAQFHFLLIPKKHIENTNALTASDKQMGEFWNKFSGNLIQVFNIFSHRYEANHVGAVGEKQPAWYEWDFPWIPCSTFQFSETLASPWHCTNFGDETYKPMGFQAQQLLVQKLRHDHCITLEKFLVPIFKIFGGRWRFFIPKNKDVLI